MKQLLIVLALIVGIAAADNAAAQNVQIVSNNDFHKCQGVVRRLQIDFCFDNYQHHTYWYDERGSLVQYVEVLRQGSSTLRSIDTLIIQGGRVVQQRHYSYSGGSPSGSKVTKPGSSFSMPIYQIPPYYYVVASSLDGAGNWTKALYSHGDNSRYVGRKFEYAGGVSSRTQAEFERIASLVASPSKQAAAKATPTKKESAPAKKQSQPAAKKTSPTQKQAAPVSESEPIYETTAEESADEPIFSLEIGDLRMGELSEEAGSALLGAYWILAWIVLVLCGLAVWNWWSISNWFNCEAGRGIVPESFLNRKFFIALLSAAVAYLSMKLIVGLNAELLNSFDYSVWWVQYGVYFVVVALSFVPAYILLWLRRLLKASSIGSNAAKWEMRYVLLLSIAIFSTTLLVLGLILLAAILAGGGSSSGRRSGGGSSSELSVDERCRQGLCRGCQYYVNGHWCSRYGGEADQCSQEEKY